MAVKIEWVGTPTFGASDTTTIYRGDYEFTSTQLPEEVVVLTGFVASHIDNTADDNRPYWYMVKVESGIDVVYSKCTMLCNYTDYGPGPGIEELKGTMSFGVFGIVSSNLLPSVTELNAGREEAGVLGGSSDWLKFAHNGKILYGGLNIGLSCTLENIFKYDYVYGDIDNKPPLVGVDLIPSPVNNRFIKDGRTFVLRGLRGAEGLDFDPGTITTLTNRVNASEMYTYWSLIKPDENNLNKQHLLTYSENLVGYLHFDSLIDITTNTGDIYVTSRYGKTPLLLKNKTAYLRHTVVLELKGWLNA